MKTYVVSKGEIIGKLPYGFSYNINANSQIVSYRGGLVVVKGQPTNILTTQEIWVRDQKTICNSSFDIVCIESRIYKIKNCYMGSYSMYITKNRIIVQNPQIYFHEMVCDEL